MVTKIEFNYSDKHFFNVIEDKDGLIKETPCNNVEVEGPSKIFHENGETWVETDAKTWKLINIPDENISFNLDNILDLEIPKVNG